MMDDSFRPAFRRASVAAWLIGMLIVLALNGWSFEIARRSALIGLAVLTGSFAAFLGCLMASERVRHLVVRDEAVFTSHEGQWAWALATLLIIAAGCIFKVTQLSS